MDGKVLARIVSALVLIAAISGIAFLAFNAGVAQGSPVTIQAPSGEPATIPHPVYGFGYPFHRPFGFGYGFPGLFAGLFFLFIALHAFRFLFWGLRRGWGYPMHGHGHGGMHWREGVPPMFDEWHKRAHDARAEESKE